MPTKTFLNLDIKKQQKLIKAAITEFSNNNYYDVSINKIISNASIPRGSFYMYFKDKDDLFLYIIDEYNKKLNNIVKRMLIENQGDLRNTFIKLYDQVVTLIFDNNYQSVLKNIGIFYNMHSNLRKNFGHLLFLHIKEDINSSSIKSCDLEFIFSMFIHNLFLSITECFKNELNKEIKVQYLKKLDIICYGIYKEN